MIEKEKIKRYFKEYKWSNIFEMIKNNRYKPKICNEQFINKNVVITGATSGIGYFTALKYASMGANIIAINRSEEKSILLKNEIKERYGKDLIYFVADLTEIDQIKNATNFLLNLPKKIDVIIHNAGVYLKKRTTTTNGFETNFVVHYLAPFIINYKLIDKLKEQKEGRIIYVCSEGYRFAVWGLDFEDMQIEKRRYSGLKAYGNAKLAQILSMHIFAKILSEFNVTINAMHPGAVRTNTGRENGPIYKFFKKNFLDKISLSAEVSADALYYLGVSNELEKITDKFFNLTKIEDLTPPAKDMDEAEKLWEYTIK
ncbi:MAG: SDR family NAD(P)-dependent oxidoreductase, partial [Spirochaetota bacterium]